MGEQRLANVLRGRSPVLVTSVGFALVGAFGAADYFSGVELSFSVFYLLPVVLVTWYAWRWSGYAVCFASVVVSFVADHAAGRTYSHWLVAAENIVIHLVFLIVTTLLLLALKAHLELDRLQARRDTLTGILNERGFEEVGDRLTRLAMRHHHSLVMACVDLGDFRAVTDVQGRSAGDVVLHTVAQALSSGVRASDVVGRLDDDTFALLMPETSRHGAQVAIAKIREEIVRSTEEQGWTLQVSVGVALFSKAPANSAEALQAARTLAQRVVAGDKSGFLYEEQPAKRGTKGNGHAAFRQPGTSEQRVIRALSRR